MKAFQITARVAAFSCMFFIAFVTLSPIGLRPIVAGLQTEHLLAFFVVGALFGMGFPRHFLSMAIIVIASALAMEALQNLVPGRHGRLLDVDVKIVGAIAGFACAAGWNLLVSRRHRRTQ